MTPKDKRIVECDVETLFTPRAFVGDSTIETIKRRGISGIGDIIHYQGGSLLLSDVAKNAVRRLGEVIYKSPRLEGVVSINELRHVVKLEYTRWLNQHLQPDGNEFASGVVDALIAKVKNFQFLVRLEGIDLKDQVVMELGPVRIQRSDKSLLETVKFGEALQLDSVYDQFKDGLWLISSVRGSPDIALEQFEYRAGLFVGILALYGAVLYKGAIRRSHVHAMTGATGHRKAVSLLRWDIDGNHPSLTRKWGPEQALPFDAKTIADLKAHYFLNQMCSLPDLNHRTELQNAIVRSVYWFADANKDRHLTMQFIKLWSCVECFFATSKEEITEANAKGIAAILTYGGYRVVEPQQYLATKKRVKHLYDLRSRAVHRAETGHVAEEDIDGTFAMGSLDNHHNGRFEHWRL